MTGKLLGRAAGWRVGCQCLDCGGGQRSHGEQRRREDTEWRAEAMDECEEEGR